MSSVTKPCPGLPYAGVAAVPPHLQSLLEAVGSKCCDQGVVLSQIFLVFLSKAEDRFCRKGVQCLGMLDPALAGIGSREHTQNGEGGKEKK